MKSRRKPLPVTVLFVEDDPDIREQMDVALGWVVEHVYLAVNGAEGLKLYKELNPDIIITDLKMPVMDGLTMARRIKEMDSRAQIIVMSAFDDRENLIEIIDLGINAFALKPIIGNKFYTALEQCADYVILKRKHDQYEAERETLLEQLSLQATTDTLTGISNRQNFNVSLNLEMERCRRHGNRLSLVMFDVDLFKQINDSEGHLVGDTILVEICRAVSGRIRMCDTFARWGGDEFMLLLPDNDLDSSTKLAHELNVLTSSIFSGWQTAVTCSFGVTEYHPDDTRDVFTGRADEALYMAKKRGRNRVEVLQ